MIDPHAIEGALAPEQHRSVHGHAGAHAAIAAQIRTGRLPGAILLHGPQGIGKATLAFVIAREILVATGDEDFHRVDEQVSAGAHPNVQILRRSPKDSRGFYSVIRVEEVRNLRESLHMTRGRAGHRVAIIDSIDDCNVASANALLKILEEPPPETTFFLISHRPGQLLPTIKSRCHNVALRPPADEEVAQVLREQRPDIADEDITRAVLLAGGRPRRAFEALALDADSALTGLEIWLRSPLDQPAGVHLALADALGGGSQGPDISFAREMLVDWLAGEARNAALKPMDRVRLASANELWEKAHDLFAETDEINLDMRQTLVIIFDAIRKHLQAISPPTETQ